MLRRILIHTAIFSFIFLGCSQTSAQTGVVTLSGNSVADSNGPFLGLGATHMLALWRCKYDRNRLNSDCAFLASKEFKYLRILSMVGWNSYWMGHEIVPLDMTTNDGRFIAAWSDYDQQLRDCIDIIYSYGMRAEITIFADAQAYPNYSTRQAHCDRILAAIAGREHKIMHLETANEGWGNGFSGSQGETDMRNLCSYLTARTAVLVSISAEMTQTNAGLTQLYSGSTADIATQHYSRNTSVDAGWGPVRDCWDTELAAGVPPTSSNEPIGPDSTPPSETDPIRLVMAAAFAWGANLPMYVYHCNAAFDSNFTFESRPGVGDYIWLNNLLPADFANWTRNDGKESSAPFTNYAGGQANKWWPEVGGATDGCVRNTGKNNGSTFYTLPIGVNTNGLTMQARRPVSWTAYNPLTGAAAASATMNTNAQYTLAQGPRGYIINGIYTDSVSSVTVDLGTVDIQKGIANVSCCDGNTLPWTVAGRNCRVNNDVPDHYMYFNVSDGFALNGNKPNQTFTIDYYDHTTNSITLQYDATSSAYKNGPSITFTNTDTWKTVVWQVTDAYFGNRQNGGSDFRVFYSGLDFYLDNVTVNVTSVAQAPYGGTAWAIPGTVQAENYDVGGETIAYHDLSVGNAGGQYRSDSVDIETTSDTGGGYNVGFIDTGEWLEYTVNVATAGSYNINVRVTSPNTGGTYHIEMNGSNVTGTKTVPNTGGWQTWTTSTSSNITLAAGTQVMRVAIDNGGWNFNYVDIQSAVVIPPYLANSGFEGGFCSACF